MYNIGDKVYALEDISFSDTILIKKEQVLTINEILNSDSLKNHNLPYQYFKFKELDYDRFINNQYFKKIKFLRKQKLNSIL